MPEDRKKLLEALAAKRKAEAAGGGRKKPKASVLSPAKKPSSKSGIDKLKAPSLHVKKQEKIKKKKKVERYESEGSDEEEEEDVLSESEEDFVDESDEETVKKPSKAPIKSVQGKTPLKHDAKGSKEILAIGKEKENLKSKGATKVKGKGKLRDDNSSDEGVDDEEDGGDLSEDPLDEVDTSNIISGRTRRRATQPIRYEFGDASGDDDDDSDA